MVAASTLGFPEGMAGGGRERLGHLDRDSFVSHGFGCFALAIHGGFTDDPDGFFEPVSRLCGGFEEVLGCSPANSMMRIMVIGCDFA